MRSIKCENVSKIYKQGDLAVKALNDVSLVIDNKSFMSISGPSGSGKTTLLNLIGGLDKPSSGKIWVENKRIDSMNKADLANLRLQHIGFVFQAYNLIPVLSARENVEFVMQVQGIPVKERRKKALQVLDDVGLSKMYNRRPAELSGGQQQRVAVARAIASNPNLVLADEPTANLDSSTAMKLLKLMKRMNEERGITFVFSTHDSMVMEFADRLLKLHDGYIESDTLN